MDGQDHVLSQADALTKNGNIWDNIYTELLSYVHILSTVPGWWWCGGVQEHCLKLSRFLALLSCSYKQFWVAQQNTVELFSGCYSHI